MNMTSSKKPPNSEQQMAIIHSGGKLLSAGAGSGKTFVLIEHLVYLLRQVQKNSSSTQLSKTISNELSRIVLMTFTKKAAGEMSVRMMKRVEEILEESSASNNQEDLIFWNFVRQNLSFLNITTIHAFCHRLLRLGFWSDLTQEVNLVSVMEHKDKLQKLFDRWFVENQKNLDPIFLASSESLLESMNEIFNSPELRVLWANPKISKSAEEEMDQFFLQFMDLKGYSSLFQNKIELEVTAKEKSKKWYELLVQFDAMLETHGLISSLNYKNYHDFFKTISKFPTTNSIEISESQKETLGLIRSLREELNELVVDLEALKENFKIYKNWAETISHLFSYINNHYFEIDGFSYSDLEYYVLEGLKNPSVLAKVQESYSYFIVDEFQDTSFIQFQILRKLIGNNSEKILCVGDKKQAIYGFRGGELQVFNECAQFVGKENNYFLKNNFRSLGSIIEFNNQLFDKVFPLGLKFVGSDPHSVEMESQVIPTSTNSSEGEVVALRTEITGELNEINIDQIEARVLSDHIKKLYSDDKFQSICVLYRKLRPSRYLLEHLLNDDIGFAAQVKINFSDDPMINLFLYLIELNLNQNNLAKIKSTRSLLCTLLELIGVSPVSDSQIDQFSIDLKILGPRLAFYKFVFSVGLSNSYHAFNTSLIDDICRLTKEDIMRVYHLLKNDAGENYSCEMMSGDISSKSSKRITIMSAHASKGLEFDAVLIGGAHTNGNYNGMRNLVGKLPHSFKWKKSFDQKQYFKSPFYHLEADILTLKDFSESKRLLYVACSRAVKHLAFADLWKVERGEIKNVFDNSNSWIQALRLNQTTFINSSIANLVQEKFEVSLIQKDSLGILAQKYNSALGLVSELSVTRLATIADCPFKFYLQNICKIEAEQEPSIIISKEKPIEENDNDEAFFYSSKKRGTEVHSLLSKLFLGEITLNSIPDKEKDKVAWAYGLADKFPDKLEVISEKMIKFSFFGQTISGTPDLVIINKDESIIVWDFKTGVRDQKNEASYWFQLMSYAFAYGNLRAVEPDKKIELSLLYLDQSINAIQNLSLNEITQLLFAYWKKTESLNQVNSNHCSYCEYTLICRKGAKSL